MKSKFNKESILLLFLLVVYALSIFWINFHSALFYRMDTYTYSYEARLMFEQRTCFPENWIFGNQYHIIASPNLAALFYGIVRDSTLSMAWASSLSFILVLLSFIWCFKGYLGEKAMISGLLCLGGGIIFGTSAGLYISGLQVLYTMASYYACYLIGLLLTLGCWIRLNQGKRPGILWIILVVCINFALGMQSLRETLILNIPLLILESFYVLCRIYKKESPQTAILYNSSLWFSFALLAVELAGYVFMKSLNVLSTPIIGDLELNMQPSALLANTWASVKNVLRISGITIAADGMKYILLSICGMVVALNILWAVVHIIRKKDSSPLSKSILFSLLSVLCVFGIGVFLMRTRDIYFFTYWVLATLCICYTMENIKWSKWLIPALVTICLVNYYYNFIPDYKMYHSDYARLEAFTQHLIQDEKASVVYTSSRPVFAAASHDRIISQSFWLDVPMESGYPLTVLPSDKHSVIYDDAHYEDALFCFSSDYLNFLKIAPEEYRGYLLNHLEFVDSFELSSGERFETWNKACRIKGSSDRFQGMPCC